MRRRWTPAGGEDRPKSLAAEKMLAYLPDLPELERARKYARWIAEGRWEEGSDDQKLGVRYLLHNLWRAYKFERRLETAPWSYDPYMRMLRAWLLRDLLFYGSEMNLFPSKGWDRRRNGRRFEVPGPDFEEKSFDEAELT